MSDNALNFVSDLNDSSSNKQKMSVHEVLYVCIISQYRQFHYNYFYYSDIYA